MESPNRASPTPRHILSSRTQRHTRPGTGTQTPEGSATTTITSLTSPPDGLVLRLRGEHEATSTTSTDPRQRRRIQWAEDVIDNEGLGRKKSKVCCIYHKTREVGESSSEDDSSSSGESDSDASSGGDDGAARPVGGYKRGKGRRGPARRGHKGHKHDGGDDCDGHAHGLGHGGEKAKRKPSPNAYERMPKYDVKPLERQPGS